MMIVTRRGRIIILLQNYLCLSIELRWKRVRSLGTSIFVSVSVHRK